MSRPSRCSLHLEEFTFREQPRKHTIQNAWFGSNSETRWRFSDNLGSDIVAQYSLGPIITLRSRITANEYVDMFGNQAYPMIHMLFPNNDAIFVTIIPKFTQLELFSRGLKSMKVNVSTFPGQYSHQI
jgi:hypothetical protein